MSSGSGVLELRVTLSVVPLNIFLSGISIMPYCRTSSTAAPSNTAAVLHSHDHPQPPPLHSLCGCVSLHGSAP